MTTKPFADIVLLVARFLVAFLMLHHGFEKLADIDGFTSFIVFFISNWNFYPHISGWIVLDYDICFDFSFQRYRIAGCST